VSHEPVSVVEIDGERYFRRLVITETSPRDRDATPLRVWREKAVGDYVVRTAGDGTLHAGSLAPWAQQDENAIWLRIEFVHIPTRLLEGVPWSRLADASAWREHL
jgi:hypothetical protein